MDPNMAQTTPLLSGWPANCESRTSRSSSACDPTPCAHPAAGWIHCV